MQKLIYVEADFTYPNPLALFIGRSAGAEEEKSRTPFVGKAGKFLRSSIKEVGFENERMAFTNVIKVRPENNRAPTKDEIRSWLSTLEMDLFYFRRENPELKLIAVGKTAEFALEALHYYHFYAIIHPSYALRFGKTKEFKEKLKEILKDTD